jgi:long-chain acyl-CoA synthetase
VISLDALRELGRAYNTHIPDGADAPRGSLQARRPGHPDLHLGHHRQAQGRHAQPRRLVYTVRGYNTLISQDEADERMCFLPLCHMAERMGGEYFSLYTGAKLNFVENPETVPENVREIAPTVFTAVPRVWEKFYSGVMIALKEATPCSNGRLCLGHWRGHSASPTRCWRAAGGWLAEVKFTIARWIALNNARKLIGIHRAASWSRAQRPSRPSW